MKTLIKILFLCIFWVSCSNFSENNNGEEKKIKTYNMTTDDPGKGYVNIDGQIYEKGTVPRDSSRISKEKQ